MAPETSSSSSNWLSFSLSSQLEMFNNNNNSSNNNNNSSSHHHHQPATTVHVHDHNNNNNSDIDQHYYSFADNFYGWPSQKTQLEMYNNNTNNSESDHNQVVYTMHHPQAPKLEDFFADSNETQDDSSLTHNIYDHHHNHTHTHNPYFGDQGMTGGGFQAFSANSGSEVDDSGFTHSPVVESPTDQMVVYSQCGVVNTTSDGLSLGVNNNNHVVIGTTTNVNVGNNLCNSSAGRDTNNNINSNVNNNNNKAIVETGSCKKISDTFGQRTSIYRGVTRHRWTGRYEAHLWDNSCRREGQARKGRQVYLGGYDKEDKAARAYDLAALKYWGPTATTNFPMATYAKEVEDMKNATKQEFIASLRRKSSGFSRGASIYRGVTRHHQQGRWQARIGRVAGNKDLYLGTFATEEEAAEAYDIAAIKFRGVNAVTNFEMNRYDVEAIANSPLPVGGTAKRLKLSLEAEEKLNATAALTQTPPTTTSISFSTMPPVSTIPYGVPYDANSAPYYHQNLFHHHQLGPTTSDTSSSVSSMMTPMNLMPSQPEFFIWPQQNY